MGKHIKFLKDAPAVTVAPIRVKIREIDFRSEISHYLPKLLKTRVDATGNVVQRGAISRPQMFRTTCDRVREAVPWSQAVDWQEVRGLPVEI
jgi:hypothetical protein